MTSALYIVFLPLIAAIIAGFGRNIIGDKGAQWVTCSAVVISAILSVSLFSTITHGDHGYVYTILKWISSGDFTLNWALQIDTLSVVMFVVVTVVSSVVHLYSIGYMEHDKSKARFFSYLSLFTFAMLMLVSSDNLIQMFFGWEGVGLASYLLIGFWNKKESANSAAIKAFLVNRVGDLGFALGIMTVFVIFGSVSFSEIFSVVPQFSTNTFPILGYEVHAISLACALLFIGAMGKSAQLGLHTWLPDAMEGPTPVSALIHAATMVTAGVFMVARLSPLFEYAPSVLAFIAVVGALTAFVAATIALTQFDIKRVIAYSTMSQLGYMFFAIGVSAYGAAIFHLFTHAFFKALLFLGAGSVIHAMSDEQDMRKMGGLWKRIPVTYAYMWIGSLALAGIPIFAGYYSKDMILETAFAAHSGVGLFAYWTGVVAAFMTAFYSWRLIVMTFHGKARAEHSVMEHVHESPFIMNGPMAVLALGALLAGILGYEEFVGHHYQEFWNNTILTVGGNVIEAAHHVPKWVKLTPLFVALSGVILALIIYIKFERLPIKIASALRPIYRLFSNKWYFDELYNIVFVSGSKKLGHIFWQYGDRLGIDGFGPDGLTRLSRRIASSLSHFQTGYIFSYVIVMLMGAVVFLTWLLFGGTGGFLW